MDLAIRKPLGKNTVDIARGFRVAIRDEVTIVESPVRLGVTIVG